MVSSVNVTSNGSKHTVANTDLLVVGGYLVLSQITRLLLEWERDTVCIQHGPYIQALIRCTYMYQPEKWSGYNLSHLHDWWCWP